MTTQPNQELPVWKVSQAKARLSELMRLAENGQPQVIGTRRPCVLIPLDIWQRKQSADSKEEVHLGRWLIENAPRGVNFEPPSRNLPERPIPFIDYAIDPEDPEE